MNGNFKQQLNKKCNKVRAGKWEVYKSANQEILVTDICTDTNQLTKK